MASSYFTLPSFARAKKNKDQLEKAGVKDPVLNDDDEKFLARVASNDSSNNSKKTLTKTRIADDGTATDTGKDGTDEVVIFPSKQPDKDHDASDTSALQPSSKKTKTDPLKELPSQEEAEAATKGFQAATQAQADKKDDTQSWASYIQSLPAKVKSSGASIKGEDDDRTCREFASSYLPALPASWTKSKDIKTEPVYKDDGSVDEEATKDKQEKEVSVLLDNLSLSSINNRVFSFSNESQKVYERFVQVLKDVINGVPTAYDDMEKLMKEAGPTIEKQWNAMPPFVQTLVKALPAKLGATLGPEFLAATSEKPGFDAKTMNAANDKTSKGDKSSSSKKKKRSFKIPGLKGLVKKQGLAATILRNIVVFFETRFPFLVTTTNVVMSLSVFVLMFVFYYCWKRGRDVRLAKEHEVNLQNSKLQPVGDDGADPDSDDDDDEIEVEITDEDDEDEDNVQRSEVEIAKSIEQKNKVLRQKDPAQVPLPITPGTDKA